VDVQNQNWVEKKNEFGNIENFKILVFKWNVTILNNTITLIKLLKISISFDEVIQI